MNIEKLKEYLRLKIEECHEDAYNSMNDMRATRFMGKASAYKEILEVIIKDEI